MNDQEVIASLKKRFGPTLDSDEIDEIVSAFASVASETQGAAFNIGLILSDFSLKAAASYFRILPEVLQVIEPDELGAWVGMGIKVAQKSAATGIRFFKKGPSIFSRIASRPLRVLFIREGIVLADGDVNLAVEYYLNAPLLLENNLLTEEAFSEWIAEGRALGEVDYTLAVEYFRITPTLLPHLPIHLLSSWVAVGRKLATEKLLPTLLFMRNSPEIFSKISSDPIKKQLLDLTAEVAEQRPPLAGQLFAESTTVLPPFQEKKLESVLIEKAIQIAQFDGVLATTFFLSGPKILKEMGEVADRFPEWGDQGIALLKKGPETASAYFSLQGKSGRAAIDQLRGGISLSSVSRTLKLFAEALSGKRVIVKPTTELKEARSEAQADQPTTDGETIYLPPHVGHFATDRLNFEWYKVSTAYQAGYLEYGTFYPQMNETADLIESIQNRYQGRGGFSSLSSFFSLFPEPGMIRQLFELAEGARVEFFLRREYPGLRQAMIRMRAADLEGRPSLVGMTPRGVVLELLTQISLSGKTKEPIPNAIQSLLFEACRILGVVQDPAATVASSMKAASTAYEFLETEDDHPEPSDTPMEAFDSEEATQVKGKGESSGELRPSTRGAIDPKRVEEAQKVKQAYTDELIEKLKKAGLDLSIETVASAISQSLERGALKLESFKEGSPEDALDRVAEQVVADQKGSTGVSGKRSFFYDEWNCVEQDYRPAWCRLVEKPVPSDASTDVESVLDDYRGITQSIVSAFQMLRPEGLKRVKGEPEGDAFDLDALMASRVEMKSGRSPSERIYISRQKKERSVSVAFLADLSGSTQQQLPDHNKSILQVEKEALLLMSKAVDAIGDSFALYGFSGRGKDAVDFYILKEFGEPYTSAIDHRIAHMKPEVQNRDGAAIRHAVSKLAAQPAKIKTFVLISDGKPLDDDYRGSYATADTKMALREAKRMGVHPYCITVDREGAEYLKGMYGEIAYMVIDHVERLPIRLPQIYKRLTT
ncbi:MAG: nitric oxide reductase activation protein NorD [Nitrospiria bacterium]